MTKNYRCLWIFWGLLLLFPVARAASIVNDTRAFNSALKLKIFERGTPGNRDRVIGVTPAPSKRPLRVPASALWYARPLNALTVPGLKKLAALVRESDMPGLDLSDQSDITDESLASLQSLTTLRMLDLSQTPVTDRGIAFLRPLKNLTIFLAPESMSDQGLSKLAQFSALRELSLDRSRVTDQGIDRLASMATLESLDISATLISDHAMAELATLPHLEHLILNSQITDKGVAQLKNARALKELDISQTQVGPQGMKSIAALPHLETLYVGSTFDDLGAAHLSRSPSLRTLDLTHSAITDQGVYALRHLKTLQELALSQTGLSNKSVASLAELPELRMLELSDTGITSAGLAPLAGCRYLQVISLSWNSLTEADLKGLTQLTHLQTIVLNGVPLPERTMAELRTMTFKPLARPNIPLPTPARPASLNPDDIDSPPPADLFIKPSTEGITRLLNAITLQSNPARGGGLSSLADLKQVRDAQDHGRLKDVLMDSGQETITQQEDRPENSLGEFTIAAPHAKHPKRH